MTDWRSFLEKEWLFAYDLLGDDGAARDVTVTIEKVTGGEIVGEGGKKTKKPVVSFVGAKKRLALNATNGKTIAGLYGNNVEDWVGKRITLFPSTTQFGGKEVACIRVRPRIPPAAEARNGAPAAGGGKS